MHKEDPAHIIAENQLSLSRPLTKDELATFRKDMSDYGLEQVTFSEK